MAAFWVVRTTIVWTIHRYAEYFNKMKTYCPYGHGHCGKIAVVAKLRRVHCHQSQTNRDADETSMRPQGVTKMQSVRMYT